MDNVKLKRLHSKMFERCKRKGTTYEGCSVSERFKNFEEFKKWCYEQVGFGKEGFHLDKDILVKGNKIYSEDTCCFVPQEINSFYTRANKIRGKYPVGVFFNKRSGRFVASISIEDMTKKLGSYDNEWSAFMSYKIAKQQRAKYLANKWKGQIDERVYEALMNYNVLLTD